MSHAADGILGSHPFQVASEPGELAGLVDRVRRLHDEFQSVQGTGGARF